jgi:hypothetical protein
VRDRGPGSLLRRQVNGVSGYQLPAMTPRSPIMHLDRWLKNIG